MKSGINLLLFSRGALGIECEGQGGPMIERSLAWLRRTLSKLGIQEIV